jgi:hypothetical protein
VAEGDSSGLYLYCIAAERPGGDALTVSAPALNGAGVRVISQCGLLVVAHGCPAEPYQGSPGDVRSWILAHNTVVTQVWERTGTVLPMAFDSIVTGDEERDAESVLADWIGAHPGELAATLGELDGKVELGIRVYYDAPAGSSERVASARGREYFQNQLSKRREAADRQLRLDAEAKRIAEGLGALAQSIRVNAPNAIAQTEGDAGGRELLSMSLLVERPRVGEVGLFLDSVTADDYRVRFTGPWPPYSFAGSLRVSERSDG